MKNYIALYFDSPCVWSVLWFCAITNTCTRRCSNCSLLHLPPFSPTASPAKYYCQHCTGGDNNNDTTVINTNRPLSVWPDLRRGSRWEVWQFVWEDKEDRQGRASLSNHSQKLRPTSRKGLVTTCLPHTASLQRYDVIASVCLENPSPCLLPLARHWVYFSCYGNLFTEAAVEQLTRIEVSGFSAPLHGPGI